MVEFQGFDVVSEPRGAGWLVGWDGDIGGVRPERSYGNGVKLWTYAELDGDYRIVGNSYTVKGTLADAKLSVAILLSQRRREAEAEAYLIGEG